MDVVFLRQPNKFIKKAKDPLKKKIGLEIFRIQINPGIGKLLQVPFKGMRCHGFIYESVHYRIAYKVKDNLIIVCVAKRENFYKKMTVYI